MPYNETLLGKCSDDGFSIMTALRALTDAEIARFLRATDVDSGDGRTEQKRRLFCQLLLYTGCLLVEARDVQRQHIDLRAKTVTIITRKNPKARGAAQRVLVMPPKWMSRLNIVVGLADRKADPLERLWPMSRTTAWRVVKDAMQRANIEGRVGTPIGLRHSFALRQLQSGKRLSEVRELLGNRSYDSMLGYIEALGVAPFPREAM